MLAQFQRMCLADNEVRGLEHSRWINTVIQKYWSTTFPEFCQQHIIPKLHVLFDKAVGAQVEGSVVCVEVYRNVCLFVCVCVCVNVNV
jgi:hypothetical protein